MSPYHAQVRRRLALTGAVLALGLAGCASAAVEPPPSSPASPAVEPAGARSGVCLDQLGFKQGPIDRICLPEGVELTYRYGAERTLIVIGPEVFGPAVLDHLAATLPGLGWRVTGRSETAVTFEDDEWRGACVIGDGVWGLTARSE